jgi:hypothetical protein
VRLICDCADAFADPREEVAARRDEVALKDKRIETLGEELAAVRDRVDRVERVARTAIEHAREHGLWIHAHEMRHNGLSTRMEAFDGRIWDLEIGEVDIQDVIDAGSNDLPIQTRTKERQTNPDALRGNRKRATYLWPEFYARSRTTSGGNLVLTTPDAVNILDEVGAKHDNETAKRAMRFVARLSGDHDDPDHDEHLIRFQSGERGKSPARLVADAEEFEQFVADAVVSDSVGERGREDGSNASDGQVENEAAERLDALMSTTVEVS